MSTVVQSACSCGSIGRTDLRQCAEHFHIWQGDRRLTSVGKIIRTCWPAPERPIPPDVLENARERGEQVDRLFAAYVLGKLDRIPRGTRKDVFKDEAPFDGLLQKLMKWYDKQNFRDVQAQVVLGAEDYGGVLDFVFDGVPCDLKATYNVEQTAVMQVAGYAVLAQRRAGNILHVTERLKEPRVLELTLDDFDDWQIMLAHWRMLQRRTA